MEVRIGDHDGGLHLPEESIVFLVIRYEPAADTALEYEDKTVYVDLRYIKHFRKMEAVKYEDLKERDKEPERDTSDQAQDDGSCFLLR